MANVELRTKKEELVKKWQDCFEEKIENAITEEGLNVFWSDETSLEDATRMLDVAGFAEALGGLPDAVIDFLLGGSSGIAVMAVSHKSEGPGAEPCNVKNGTPYRIVRKKDNHLFEMEFETEQSAKDFIENAVRHSPYTIDDFMVLKVM